MTTPHPLFTKLYFAWLDSFRLLVPGGAKAAPSEAKKEQAAANQEWEDEGGALRPEGAPQVKPTVPASR